MRFQIDVRSLRSVARVSAVIVLAASAVQADEIKVMTSGAMSAALRELAPSFERASGSTLIIVSGGSVAGVPDSIPDRLQRGERADVVIMAAGGIDDLMKAGRVVAGSRVDLARSSIGIAVRAGAPKPDISSVDALKRTLLQAKSIAYSSSVSGVYVSTELFQRLGIASQVLAKSRTVDGEPVAAVVARGEAEIGFQQISELRPVPGVEVVGPLPHDVQRVTVFSAAAAAGSTNPTGGRALVAFLSSPAASAAIAKSGMDPVTPNGPLSKPVRRGQDLSGSVGWTTSSSRGLPRAPRPTHPPGAPVSQMSAAALPAATEQLALGPALCQDADDSRAPRLGMLSVLFEHEGEVLPDELRTRDPALAGRVRKRPIVFRVVKVSAGLR